ncbi:hypothetical protein HU200_021858 [Digitaria exilis]|uniref:Uncharacterized protein n=1 Tax=Digitaria exilis TaxID=1010633 RepID=A0A835EYZ3_9POAL|nr:hypothetical protein HU200_021858 [Digitaria exilis]
MLYLIGRDESNGMWRLLKIDRLEPTSLSVVEDPTCYTAIERDDLLRRIHAGNKVTGGLKRIDGASWLLVWKLQDDAPLGERQPLTSSSSSPKADETIRIPSLPSRTGNAIVPPHTTTDLLHCLFSVELHLRSQGCHQRADAAADSRCSLNPPHSRRQIEPANGHQCCAAAIIEGPNEARSHRSNLREPNRAPLEPPQSAPKSLTKRYGTATVISLQASPSPSCNSRPCDREVPRSRAPGLAEEMKSPTAPILGIRVVFRRTEGRDRGGC